ncbi:hypothetical protein HDU79_010970 [Rhizoclosmatium sp. JEL0117]|nr:hypothetical protein HDU79_010970 [Rhizoclosmatium sp. JEL0117]
MRRLQRRRLVRDSSSESESESSETVKSAAGPASKPSQRTTESTESTESTRPTRTSLRLKRNQRSKTRQIIERQEQERRKRRKRVLNDSDSNSNSNCDSDHEDEDDEEEDDEEEEEEEDDNEQDEDDFIVDDDNIDELQRNSHSLSHKSSFANSDSATITSRLALCLHKGDTDQFAAILAKTAQKSVLFKHVSENNNRSLIHSACAHNLPDILSLLIDSLPQKSTSLTCASIFSYQDNDGLTPLHIATVYSLPCLELIRNCCTDPDAADALLLTQDNGGCTPLTRGILASAPSQNILFLIQWLYDLGLSIVESKSDAGQDDADDSIHDNSVFFSAARMARVDVLKAVRQVYGTDTLSFGLSERSKTGATPLHYACATAFALRTTAALETVEYIVKHLQSNKLERIIQARDKVDAKTKLGGRTAALFAVGSEVPWAVQGKNQEDNEDDEDGFGVEKSFFEDEEGNTKNTDENESEDQAWKKQIQKDANLLKVVTCLLDAGISCWSTEQGSETSLLHLAALHGLEEIVKLLLSRKVPPTIKDKLQWTPLIYAHYGESCDQISDGCLLALLEAKPQQLRDLMQLMNGTGHDKIIKRLMRSLATKPKAYKFVNEFLRSNESRRYDVIEWFASFPGLLDYENKRSLFERALDGVLRGECQFLLVQKDVEFLSAYEHLSQLLSYKDSDPPIISARFNDSVGSGPGVTREFWDNLSNDMLKPAYGLFGSFNSDLCSTGATSNSSDRYFFAPDRAPISPDIQIQLEDEDVNSTTLMRFAGQMCALAILNTQLLPALETLSPHVFRLLVEDTIRLEWSDFETLDQELWKSWDWVMKAGKSELKAAELTFSYESRNRKGQVLTKAFSGYEGTEVVDVKNREEFVKLAAKNHVRRVRFKIVAFREG